MITHFFTNTDLIVSVILGGVYPNLFLLFVHDLFSFGSVTNVILLSSFISMINFGLEDEINMNEVNRQIQLFAYLLTLIELGHCLDVNILWILLHSLSAVAFKDLKKTLDLSLFEALCFHQILGIVLYYGIRLVSERKFELGLNSLQYDISSILIINSIFCLSFTFSGELKLNLCTQNAYYI
jgi:hypothetical protein